MASNIELLDSIISQVSELKEIVEQNKNTGAKFPEINNDLKNIDGHLDRLLDYIKDE